MDIIDNFLNFLKKLGFLEVGVGTALLLIPTVGVHILEERIKGFRRFFNQDWFGSDNEEFPVTKLEALLKDQIGLFLGLTLLALGGILWAPFILMAVGFITADLIQHTVFSIGRRRYTPGVATSALYLGYVVYFFKVQQLQLGLWTLIFLALGASFLLLNYIIAAKKVRKRRERQMPQSVTA